MSFGQHDVAADAGDARPLVSVVIPVYNEGALLERSLTAVLDHLTTLEHRFEFEVLLVDDGSRDHTRAIAEHIAASDDRLTVLGHRRNFDLGSALRYGFGVSRGRWVVAFDADLTYSPDHITRLLDTAEQTGARVVVASPYMEGGETHGIPRVRELLSRGANRFLSWANEGRVHTITSMVRAYDGPFIRTLDTKALGPDVNTEIIRKAQILRARIVEVPAVLDWREVAPLRSGRGNRLRLYWNILQQIGSAFLFRPYIFFMIPGALVALAAIGLTAWACGLVLTHDGGGGIEHAIAESYDEYPLVFLGAGGSVVIAVQLLTLAVITFQAKRYAEELYHVAMTVRRSVSDEPELRQRYR